MRALRRRAAKIAHGTVMHQHRTTATADNASPWPPNALEMAIAIGRTITETTISAATPCTIDT